MLKIYDLLVSLGWSIYKFADERRCDILHKQLLNDATQQVYWQDFFDPKPTTDDLRDVFIEDDEEL